MSKETTNKIYSCQIKSKTLFLSIVGSLGIACSNSNAFGGLAASKNKSISPKSSVEQNAAAAQDKLSGKTTIITRDTVESYLFDLKNKPDAAVNRSFAALQDAATDEHLLISWSSVSNSPVEIMGYSFENLADWGVVLKNEIANLSGEYPTISNYFESRGVTSVSHILIEDIETNLAAAEQFFSQDPTVWAQNRNSGQQEASFALLEDKKALIPIKKCPHQGGYISPTHVWPPSAGLGPQLTPGLGENPRALAPGNFPTDSSGLPVDRPPPGILGYGGKGDHCVTLGSQASGESESIQPGAEGGFWGP